VLRLHLLRQLVWRDFSGRYAGSVFGVLWSLVQPLWQLALFSFVFAVVLRLRPTGEATDSFAIFLFAGLLPWMAVNETLVRGATAVTDNGPLVKKLSFPTAILVVSVAISALLHQLVALGAFLLVLAARGELAWRALPWLLVAMPLQLALSVGLALALAALNVVVRDTVQGLQPALTAWFYATPIVYPLALVPDTVRPWIELNPLTTLVGLYRAALLGSAPPGLAAAPAWLALVLFAFGTLALGGTLFRRLAPTLADEV
jgi:lipopolysaccharide transport system permease protein